MLMEILSAACPITRIRDNAPSQDYILCFNAFNVIRHDKQQDMWLLYKTDNK